MNNNPKPWSSFIKEKRESISMTQDELAEKSGIPQSTISRYESGTSMKIDVFARILKAMGVSWKVEGKDDESA